MDKQSFYVATSIPYVNGEPHLGHAMEFVLGDVIARYHAQQGETVFFSVGTDEHGGKVMEKAESTKMTPKQYADQISQLFKDILKELNVDYSKFIRTTDTEHEVAAQAIFKALNPDDVYLGKYVGMYDQREESFLNAEQVAELKEHNPSRYDQLQELEEENHFFKLSKYNDQIKQAIATGEMEIVPNTRKNETLALLDRGLEDISISRPHEKIPWGIPVPGDQNQTIYVWFEALMNYITTLGYPNGENFKTFWPCNVHVVGKDIARFHTAIWPAMLLSLGLPLPKTIYVHGFINIDGAKMSKSDGNVIDPAEIISAYGVDAFRYFITRHVPSNEDGDFTWVKFETAYNTELGNELGNLAQRTASMIERYQQGVIGKLPESMHDIGPYHDAMADFRFDKALDYVWTLIRGQNQYIENSKPWQIAKENDPAHLQEVLASVASALLQVADMLAPFMPHTSSELIKMFGEERVVLGATSLYPKIHNHTEAKS